MTWAASVEQWRPLLEENAGDLPVEFLLAWIDRESGGNACSYTRYHEAGIFQLMPPDNLDDAGVSLDELRAACSGSTQQLARPLTDDERLVQVTSGIRYVNVCRDRARAKLAAAGADWPETSTDFWKAVKLQHAYPAALNYVKQAPGGWDELAVYVYANHPELAGVMANAAAVGAYGGAAGASLGRYGALLVPLAGLAGGLVLGRKR
jgi:hypothetical protein